MNRYDASNPTPQNFLKIETGPVRQKAKSLGLLGLFSRGSEKSRIDLKITGTTGDMFKIAAERHSESSLAPSESRRNILIKVQVGEDTNPTFLKVNRNSLVKRLGIDVKDLQKAEERGIDFLSNFVAGQAEAIQKDVNFVGHEINTSFDKIKRYFTSFEKYPYTSKQYSEMENSFRTINQYMRMIDPSKALLEALGPKTAKQLEEKLEKNRPDVESLKKLYKGIKESVKLNRQQTSHRTALPKEDVRFFALYGNEREKTIATRGIPAKLTQEEKDNFDNLINSIIVRLKKENGAPVEGYEFLWELSATIDKSRIIDMLEFNFTKKKGKTNREILTRPEMLTTLKQIADHIKSSSRKDPNYVKQVPGLNFGWSTDAKGHVYIRTGNVIGRGGFKKAAEEICLNTGRRLVSLSVTNGRDIIEARAGNKIAAWLQEMGVPNILKPSISEYMTETKTNAKDEYAKKWIIRLPQKEQVGLLIDEKNVNKPPVSVADLLRIAKGTAETLVKMHKLGWVHGDIKPDNILLGKKKPYVIDYDGACKVGRPIKNFTPRYVPPEVYNLKGNIKTKAIDAFSLGATLIDLMTNCRLDLILQNKEGYKNLRTKKGPLVGNDRDRKTSRNSEFRDALTNRGVANFIQDLKDGLEKTRRYTGEDLVKVKSILDIVQGLLNPDPKQRTTCGFALKRLDTI